MPQEVHEHYALPDGPDGKPVLTGYTVITRETEWDDETRQRALDLAEHENSLCSCGCGRPAAETFRPNQVYAVKTARCAAGRAIDLTRRQMSEANKENPGWDDGLHFYAEHDEAASAKVTADQATLAAEKTETKRRRTTRGR